MRMPHLLLLTLFLLVCAVTCRLQAEQTRTGWKCEQDPADCVGAVQFRVAKAYWPEAEGTFEIRSFSNGEWLFSNLTGDTVVQFLGLPNDTGIYYGVRNDEELWRHSRIFQEGVGRVLWAAFALFVTAYPEGIDTMQTEWTTRLFEFEGKPFQLSSRKSSATSFDFRFVSTSDWDVSGLWSMEKTPPWADDQPLVGWSGYGQRTYRTLGELRRAPVRKKP